MTDPPSYTVKAFTHYGLYWTGSDNAKITDLPSYTVKAFTHYGLNRQAVRDEINVQGYVLQGCAKKWASGWENFLGKLRQKW